MSPEEEEAHVNMLLENSDAIKQAFFGGPSTPALEHMSSYEKKAPRKTARNLTSWPVNKRKPARRVAATEREPLPTCAHCGSTDLIRDDKHGDTVCGNCATCSYTPITNDAFKCLACDDYGKLKSYTDALRKRNCYKKTNYFNEMLKYLAGKQQLDVSSDVWDIIKHQDYMTTPVRASDIRDVLKKHKLHKFYRHASLLARMVNQAEGVSVPPTLTYQEEDLLKYMFQRFCQVFSKIRGNRKNCLNYAYVMYQFLRLINRDDLCDHVSMLKCRSRLHQHDRFWKEFCGHVKWLYIPYLI